MSALEVTSSPNPSEIMAKAVPALAKCLDDENGDVRATAVVALERCGPTAKDAVPALTKAAKEGDEKTRAAAAKALAQIQGK